MRVFACGRYGGRVPYRANGWTALADLVDTEGNGFTFYNQLE